VTQTTTNRTFNSSQSALLISHCQGMPEASIPKGPQIEKDMKEFFTRIMMLE